MTDLRERRLTDVGLDGVRSVTLQDGSPGAAGTVTLRLADEADGQNGPIATISLSVPDEHGDAERAIVEGAVAVLQRLARESREELAVLLNVFRKEHG